MAGSETDDEAGRRNQRRADRWHVGKEVPLALLVALSVQTVGVVWGAATVWAKVEFLKEANIAAQIVQTAIDRRQDDDAQRSENRIMGQFDKLNTKVDRLLENKK